MFIPHTLTPTSLALVLDSRHRQLDKSHINFNTVKETLLKVLATTEADAGPLLDRLRELIDIPSFIAKITEGRFQVSANEVRYDGAPIHGHVAERLLWLLGAGGDIRPLLRFLNRLHNSHIVPSAGVDLRDEFLRWVEASNMPFTEDGCILAYKFVRANYRDSHSGTIDNSIGAAIPRIAPDVINTDRNQTCAASGYHFCSFGYLGEGNPHVMIVKIAPEDIASFPYHDEIAKGRCLWYEVISEVPQEELQARRIEDHVVLRGDKESIDDAIAGRDNSWGSADALHEHAPEGDEALDALEREEDDDEGGAIEHEDEGHPVEASEGRSAVGRERWLARLKGIKVSGRRLTPESLLELIGKHGQREVSRRTGIPRATLQGWLA